VLGDQYPQLLGLELVVKICSGIRIIEHDQVQTNKGIFVSRGPPAAGASQGGAKHLVWHHEPLCTKPRHQFGRDLFVDVLLLGFCGDPLLVSNKVASAFLF
jgi:hypothetical protein